MEGYIWWLRVPLVVVMENCVVCCLRHFLVCAVMFLRVVIVCWCEVGGIFWVVYGEGCIIVSCRVCVVV